MPTKVIDNFTGNMVPQVNGDMNSGNSYWVDVFGYDPFTKPGNLTWSEQQTQIDSAGSVITDLIMAGKTRVESGIIYVYAIGHTGRLYKIQVNNPATSNPNFDNPVLLATLTAESPTFTTGGFIDFFGSTERIYIGHDKGVTRVNFDGTSETFVGVAGSYTASVPRVLQQFLGKLYFGNGTNIGEIDSTATITTYTKLSPGLPVSTQLRDIRTSIDGNYLNIISSEQGVNSLLATTPDVPLTAPSNSYLFRWNGIDTGYTSSVLFPKTVLTAMAIGANAEWYMGYDHFSTCIFKGFEKIETSLPDIPAGSTSPNSIFTLGNQMVWGQQIFYLGNDWFIAQIYGKLDKNVPEGFWPVNFHQAISPETDIINVPMFSMVSSIGRSGAASSYTDQLYMFPKVYYSTLETSTGPTTKYRFYKWPLYPTGQGTPISGALFQTQNQLFSEKIAIKEVRVYVDPLVANNAFTIDLIGTNDIPITNASQTFTVGTNATAGDDLLRYAPDANQTYTLGLRITNAGTKNMVFHKVEIDYEFVKS